MSCHPNTHVNRDHLFNATWASRGRPAPIMPALLRHLLLQSPTSFANTPPSRRQPLTLYLNYTEWCRNNLGSSIARSERWWARGEEKEHDNDVSSRSSLSQSPRHRPRRSRSITMHWSIGTRDCRAERNENGKTEERIGGWKVWWGKCVGSCEMLWKYLTVTVFSNKNILVDHAGDGKHCKTSVVELLVLVWNPAFIAVIHPVCGSEEIPGNVSWSLLNLLGEPLNSTTSKNKLNPSNNGKLVVGQSTVESGVDTSNIEVPAKGGGPLLRPNPLERPRGSKNPTWGVIPTTVSSAHAAIPVETGGVLAGAKAALFH